MERIIKFRAWDDHHKEMITPYCELKDTRFWGFDLTNNPLYPSVVMQYTGLKDKSGTEIYEGDIMMGGYKRVPKVVKYINACFHLVNPKNHGIRNFALSRASATSMLVIGNIHANPELIQS